MVFLQMIFTVIIERFPPDNAEISFMAVTNTVQGGYCVIEQRVISYDNVNINDWFCRQPSHRSAADMLNTQSQFAESILNLIFYFYKILLPDLIIGQDCNMFCNHFHSPVQTPTYQILPVQQLIISPNYKKSTVWRQTPRKNRPDKNVGAKAYSLSSRLTYSILRFIDLYAGRIILPPVSVSSILCADHPAILAVAKSAVASSSGILIIR